MRYILNSAVITDEGVYRYKKIKVDEAKDWLKIGGYVSAIGYKETSDALEVLTGIKLEVNRVQVKLLKGDEALIFRITKRVTDPNQKGELTKDYVLENCEFGILTKIE